MTDTPTAQTRAAPPCPRCDARTSVPIAYGYPSQKGFDAARRGEIELGGCIAQDNNPRWHCRSCGHRWRDSD